MFLSFSLFLSPSLKLINMSSGEVFIHPVFIKSFIYKLMFLEVVGQEIMTKIKVLVVQWSKRSVIGKLL